MLIERYRGDHVKIAAFRCSARRFGAEHLHWPSQAKASTFTGLPQRSGRGQTSVTGARPSRMRPAVFLLIALALGVCAARAQDNASQEAVHRAEVLAHLPRDAARVLFGREATPAPGQPRSIGAYERGCLEGAVPLPAD